MSQTPNQQATKISEALREGRFPAALKLAKSAMKAAPRQALFANLAGLAAVRMGDPRGAVGYFLTATRTDPTMIEAARNLAQALIQAAEPEKALAVLGKAGRTWPGEAGLSYLTVSAHHATGDATATIAAADTALALHPKAAAVLNLRALAQDRLGDSAAAEADFRAALAAAPLDAETLRNHAQFLAYHAEGAAATAAVERGLAAHPAHPGLLLQQANLLQAQGQAEAAAAVYHRLLERHPDHPLALNGLAYVANAATAPSLMARLSKAMRAPTTAREVKVLLGFAQAILAKRSGDAAAPQLLAQANAAAAKVLPYDANADARMQALLTAPFVTPLPDRQDTAADPAPIFIVGLIRSGTTLAEQVLARHPAVAGLGELTRARFLADGQARAFAQDGTPPDGAGFAAAYRSALPELPKGTTHMVDKMPDNFRVIGYLLNAFPGATVIEMVRDPRDVALSMWENFFPTTAHAYTNALPAMADHMNLYARTMQHWRNLHPGRIHAVAYADLVRGLEPVARGMARLAGFDWHPDMLHPENSTAMVMTASAAQLRQPVHDRSVDRWRGQEAFLAPLLERLDGDLWPVLSGG